MKANLLSALDNKAQCELVIIDDADSICHLSYAPNRVTISTGQIVRVAAISKIVAKKLARGDDTSDNVHIVDPHWFDDVPPEVRQQILKKRPPPGMAPAFGDVSSPDELWSWAEKRLSPPLEGKVADLQQSICLFSLGFLVIHEAAHLMFDHIGLHRRISEEDAAWRENDQKCIEVDADLEAVKALLSGMFAADPGLDGKADLPLFFERIGLTGVGIMVGLALGEYSMRGLRTYDDPLSDSTIVRRRYPHPSVRLEVIKKFLFPFLERLVPHLGLLVAPIFLKALAMTIFAMNGWWITEAKKAGQGDWALPFPFSIVVSKEADYPSQIAEEYMKRHLPSFYARHFPERVPLLPS